MIGNDPCLVQHIDEINYFEIDGIGILTETGEFRIYFILGIILGDNLGLRLLSTILEFGKSFSSNYYYRFCKTHKLITQICSVKKILHVCVMLIL